MNLALPLWVFSEPLPPIVNEDTDCHPVLYMPVRAVPPSKHQALTTRVDKLADP